MIRLGKNSKPAAYVVGYGKPPKNTQFKPGKSGNPKGRPKGTPSLNELFLREAGRVVKVRQGEITTKITKGEAVIRRLIQMAMEGDMAATRLVVHMLAQAAVLSNEGASSGEDEFDAGFDLDGEIVQRMLARFAPQTRDPA